MDLTGDGLLDLLVGRENGGAALYRNAGTRTAPRFVEAPDVRARAAADVRAGASPTSTATAGSTSCQARSAAGWCC